MENDWTDLKEYSGYAINSNGAILNTETSHIKRTSPNQQGIAMVNFSINNRQHVRSVSVLVAETFLDRLGVPPHFDTPINLNGDRMDCRVENLAWRPRWFAVRYHQQFNPWQREHRFGFRKPVELVDTEEVFDTSWEAAIKYGMLDHEIFLATVNATVVFPHNFRFRELID